ncbi:CopD family protein [Nitrospirillum sp. BR 11163]|uniref:CopD family protein n=1 Tax=Nitrospirillum sp. BR 11163 TaxID=3104323 RepID=UPI002AFF93C2|nr:CopD family protein [Nitrospirillum sp. BR 11163]MEA1677457.1 CopD family protein [Nitrospirillum sp. BR 11163]
MPYLWLESLHAAAAVTFVAGLLAAALLLAFLPSADALSPAFWRAARAWHRWVTGPAILLVWGLGLTLAVTGGWLPSAGWLWAKLALVTALSGLHGAQAGALRRLANGQEHRRTALGRFLPALIVLAVVGILFLVIGKLF